MNDGRQVLGVDRDAIEMPVTVSRVSLESSLIYRLFDNSFSASGLNHRFRHFPKTFELSTKLSSSQKSQMHPHSNKSSNCAVIWLERWWWLWYRLKLWWFRTDDELIHNNPERRENVSSTLVNNEVILKWRFPESFTEASEERLWNSFLDATIENFSSSDYLKIDAAALHWSDNYFFII